MDDRMPHNEAIPPGQAAAARMPIPMTMTHYWRSRSGGLVCASALAITSGCALPDTPFAATRANEYTQRGAQKLENKDYEAALAQFQAAIELNPNLAVAHSKIGYIERHKGNYEAAAESYEQAVRLNPKSFDDTFSLAQVYQQLT